MNGLKLVFFFIISTCIYHSTISSKDNHINKNIDVVKDVWNQYKKMRHTKIHQELSWALTDDQQRGEGKNEKFLDTIHLFHSTMQCYRSKIYHDLRCFLNGDTFRLL